MRIIRKCFRLNQFKIKYKYLHSNIVKNKINTALNQTPLINLNLAKFMNVRYLRK